jgi:hypothetical protein
LRWFNLAEIRRIDSKTQAANAGLGRAVASGDKFGRCFPFVVVGGIL